MEDKASFCDKEEEHRKLFKLFDTVNNGFLRLEDFLALAAKYAPSLSKASIQSIFFEADRDNDGRVSYRDFERLLTLPEMEPPPSLSPGLQVPSLLHQGS